MLVDEELEVSAFTSVSSEKHLMLERILRTTGSQRLPRELLPLQESRRARPWGWVGLLRLQRALIVRLVLRGELVASI